MMSEKEVKMKKQSYILLALVLLTVLVTLIAACTGGKAGGGEASLDGKTLVETRCTKCHDLERVKAAKKSADEWKTNVERMVGKGAELNDAEQEVVAKYLTEAYPN